MLRNSVNYESAMSVAGVMGGVREVHSEAMDDPIGELAWGV